MSWKLAVKITKTTYHIINLFLLTVSCPPANLNLFRECSSNVIIFSWASTNNTAFYRAQLADSVGGTQDCITTETSCFFTNTACGRKYNFTVFSVNGECSGPVSSPVSIVTGKNTIAISNKKSVHFFLVDQAEYWRLLLHQSCQIYGINNSWKFTEIKIIISA